MSNIEQIAKLAKDAALAMAPLSTEIKNQALEAVARMLENNKDRIFEANNVDLITAKRFVDNGEITAATYARLKLDENKLRDMIQGIRDVKKLEDPVNKKLWAMKLDEGLDLYKVSCPIGVIGVIFEARPDVIAQISALAIKSSNAVILKGGKEAVNTNTVIFNLIVDALTQLKEFPKNAINQVFSRDDVAQMLQLDRYIDLIIPRGGNALVKYIKENTKIAVLGHADGICHIYVDKNADWEKSIPIIIDAKTQYPSACNAVETILIHKSIAREYLPILFNELKKANVTVRGCDESRKIIPEIINGGNAWAHEHSDLIIAVRIVENEIEAIKHINEYGSGHTDCIITEDEQARELFMDLVDSAGVYCNVSTRFADGFRYGFGAEVGISTNKTHARGPVGLEGLTIYKYKLYGSGQIVADYAKGYKSFKHIPI